MRSFIKLSILILSTLALGCDKEDAEADFESDHKNSLTVDSNYWQPYELRVNDSVIDISGLNQVYRFDDERVLVWDIKNDSLRFSGDHLDIQVWWVALNDSLLFPLNPKKYFDTDRLDEPFYRIPMVINPDSMITKGFEQIKGEVVIRRKIIRQSASNNLIRLTEENLARTIYLN